MEIDRAITKETAQASSETQTSPPKTTAAARSYECIFCKRGFSNAQALGGHMNIHRKDRAKLRHPGKQSPFPFNISVKVIPPFMGYAPQLMPNPNSCPCLLRGRGRGRGRGDDHWGSSSLGPAAVEELDLELRLGPERPDHASSMGLRQFL